ncbi:hypothetical protein LJK88_31835 [Paenibacillus sp. P26]|nr:hypothetical protein LJK88_31835 [Paenibacillus sp. P26]
MRTRSSCSTRAGSFSGAPTASLLSEDGIYATLYAIQEEGTRYAEGK